MTETVSRRAVLGAVATAGVASLAGCLGGEQPSLEPRVPEDALREDGWRHVEDIEERVEQTVEVFVVEQDVEMHLRGKAYENPRPAQRAAQALGVENPPFQPPPAQFVPIKMETDPPVHRLSGLSNTLNEQILDQIENRAMDQLGGSGIRNVRRVSEDELDIAAAGKAVHRRYRGEYVYPESETEVQGRSVTLESGTFEIESQLAVWSYEGLLAITTGTYPGETGTIDLSVGGSTQTVDLGLRPQLYRQSVRELTTLVR